MGTVLIFSGCADLRAGLFEDGRAVELLSLPALGDEEEARAPAIGDIYAARVTRLAPGMRAAFVDLGEGLEGVLPLNEEGPTEGSRLLVQTVRPPLPGKGARVSAELQLAGRYTVLKPGRTGWRPPKETSAENIWPERLAAVEAAAQDGGLLRSAAAAVSADLAAAEATALDAAFQAVTAAFAENPSPRRLSARPSSVAAIVDAFCGAGANHALMAGADGFSDVKTALAAAAPDLAPGLTRLDGAEAADQRQRLDAAFDEALDPIAPLPNGGRLIIETTTAMTTADVDAGAGALDGRRRLAVNIAAAEEIVRQTRLRGIGGQVAVDFLALDSQTDRRALVKALGAAAEAQGERLVIGPLAPFGVLAFTRKRRRAALTARTPAEAAAAALETALAADRAGRYALAAAPAIADRFETRKAWRKRLAERYGARFELRRSEDLREGTFDVFEI